MKQLLSLFFIVFLVSSANAQSPDLMSYQAVIRNAENALVAEKPVGIRIKILNKAGTGTVVYSETHKVTTNINGLATIKIGAGTVVSGNISSINWDDGLYFLETEIDPAGGTAYSINNTSQMLSVPYAMYAKSAGRSNGSWSVRGNDVTSTDYIGTTNDHPLIFKSNGSQVGNLGLSNIYWGFDAGIDGMGVNNIGIGYSSLSQNKSGSANTSVGNLSMVQNSTGERNVAIGDNSLHFNTTGYSNVALGASSLFNNTTGNYNVANGYLAQYYNTTGYSNVAIGKMALYASVDKNNLVAIGDSALMYNDGVGNTAVGSKSLFSNSTGSNNTANGSLSLSYNTTGENNTAIGQTSLYSNKTGNSNTSNGHESLYSNTSGSSNTANGRKSLYNNTIGGANAASGVESMISNTSGGGNAAFGYLALKDNTVGNYNVALGRESLKTNISGSKNTAIGYLADLSADNLTNATAIGSGAIVDASNKVRIGNTSITKIEGQVAWSFPSDARFKYNIKSNVPGLDFIKKLQPVTYYFDNDKLDAFTKTGVVNNNNIYPVSYKGEKELHTGFLAQDVEKIADELGYHFDGVRAPVNDKDHYSLAYSQFIMPLVKGMQEQQSMIDQQVKSIEQLKDIIRGLEKKVDELSKK